MNTEISEAESGESQAPRVRVPPITNRFLYVDIAALRAKQLRRGALPRLDQAPEMGFHREVPHKPERVAMEEVRRGLVDYDLPVHRPAAAQDA
jgi:DNA-directed RNA polymerase subunit K/omega